MKSFLNEDFMLSTPTARPDRALNLDKPGFAEYIRRLEDVAGYAINSISDVMRALSERIRYFAACGCRAADHGLDYVGFRSLR